MEWKTTKSLGDVVVDDKGNVHHKVSDDGRPLYPYRAVKDGWNNCVGYYKPAYLARLIREGKAMWS